jgi:hypothetical protein
VQPTTGRVLAAALLLAACAVKGTRTAPSSGSSIAMNDATRDRLERTRSITVLPLLNPTAPNASSGRTRRAST